jgi:prepilin signal peptidase PulO-like enzyme (type II secretory pathway)
MKSLTAPARHTAPRLAVPPPTCPECGHVMRIVAIEPHFSFHFLDVQKYQCECSATLSFSVARLD